MPKNFFFKKKTAMNRNKPIHFLVVFAPGTTTQTMDHEDEEDRTNWPSWTQVAPNSEDHVMPINITPMSCASSSLTVIYEKPKKSSVSMHAVEMLNSVDAKPPKKRRHSAVKSTSTPSSEMTPTLPLLPFSTTVDTSSSTALQSNAMHTSVYPTLKQLCLQLQTQSQKVLVFLEDFAEYRCFSKFVPVVMPFVPSPQEVLEVIQTNQRSWKREDLKKHIYCCGWTSTHAIRVISFQYILDANPTLATNLIAFTHWQALRC